jgi:hypothetical protein
MDEILVNTSIVGDQSASAIAGFRGTQFIVVWEDSGDGTIKGADVRRKREQKQQRVRRQSAGGKHEPEAAGRSWSAAWASPSPGPKSLAAALRR